jgi:CelD/BcsL family acetyltransferase involved in cellulose biosynthesis
VTIRADLVAVNDPRWVGALAGIRHDLYHMPAFVEFAARWHEPGTPTAFVASDGNSVFFVPLIVRPIPSTIAGEEEWFDAVGPRGYPGPIAGQVRGRADEAFIGRAVDALAGMLREHRIVTAFVRCHPLLSPPIDTLRQAGTVVEHGESVSIDLTGPAEGTWRAIRENHRRSITSARRDGYLMRIDESWARLDEFLSIYAASMDRLGAAAHWRLSPDYVTDLRVALDPGLHLCVVEKEGELAAAALLSEVDGIVEYHLAGTAPAHVAASPTKLLIEAASRWARERGNRVFHLAGSLRQDDPLIHFKRGFSPLRHTVNSWRIVADRSVYQRLVDRSGRPGGRSGSDVAADSAFFPRYRREAGSSWPDGDTQS